MIGDYMKISTKGRYGLKAMVDLAVYSMGQPLNLKSIAERQNVSEKYLEHIFSTLKKAGLIKSLKGTQGGYMLAYNSDSITVGRIIKALEGNLSTIDKASTEEGDADILDQCITQNVWQKIDESVNELMESITLEDLVNQYKNMSEGAGYMYFI